MKTMGLKTAWLEQKKHIAHTFLAAFSLTGGGGDERARGGSRMSGAHGGN